MCFEYYGCPLKFRPRKCWESCFHMSNPHEQLRFPRHHEMANLYLSTLKAAQSSHNSKRPFLYHCKFIFTNSSQYNTVWSFDRLFKSTPLVVLRNIRSQEVSTTFTSFCKRKNCREPSYSRRPPSKHFIGIATDFILALEAAAAFSNGNASWKRQENHGAACATVKRLGMINVPFFTLLLTKLSSHDVKLVHHLQ